MNFFTKFSIKNPAVIFILVLLVTLGGVYSATGLKQETMPDISIPIIAVVTPFPGAGPSDVLDDVTKPLEKSLSSISGIKTVNSTSSENVSAVIAEFGYSADMDEAKREVEEAVKKVKLPEGVMEPQITRISFGSFPVLKLSVTNEKLSTEELEKEIRETLMPKLSGIEGVGQVQIASEKQKSVFVKLLPEKLKKYNLTTQTVTQLLQANNISFPTGSVKMGEQAKPVRVTGEIKTLAELKNLKLPLFPNAQDGMKDAFGQIGQGMSALGEAMGQMGQGMVGLGQGLGGQIQLLSAIQDTQANIFAGKLALNEAKATLNNPNATEQEKQMANMTIQQLTPQLQMGEMALKQMQDQLKKIQALMQQGASASKKPASSKKTTSATTNNSTTIKQIKLSQIAEITVGEKEAEVYSRTDGKDSVVIDLIKAQDANTVDVVDNAQAAMEDIKDKLPKGTNFTVILDQGEMVKASVNGMVREGLLGAAFAALIIMLFLRNLRSTLIALVSIPLSILITLLLIKQAGITLNIMTLGGLTVAVGRVVDDSIVVIENIFRKLQTNTYRTLDIVIMGTKEVASAITSSTLTTVAVFIPLGLVEGMIGKIFMPFALTVALALLSSLIVAITIVPLLAKLLLLKAKVPHHEENYDGPVMSIYRRALIWSLNHKAIVIITSIVVLIGSFSLVPLIGTSFIPESKEKFVSIDVEYPAGTSINAVNKKTINIEKYLAEDKSVSNFQTTVGSVAGAMNNLGKVEGSNVSHIFIALTPEANVDELVKKYRKEFPGDTKAKITINQASTGGGGGSSNKLEVIVRGSKLSEIREGAKILTKELAKVDGLDNIANNLGESKPEIAINVDQDKASKVGLSAAQIMGTIRELLNYKEIGTIKVNNDELKINLGLKMMSFNKLKDMQNLELTTPLGKEIKLSSVAQVKEIPGPTSLYTRNGEEYANVSASILGNDTGKVTKDVQAKIDTLKLPDGVTTQIGGTVEQMNESFKQLGIAMIVAILSVYLVMVIAFSEALAPFAILFSLPLAIIGGLVGLFIAGIPLNMPAMIGALMLIGIVVTNAIVLLDRVKQQQKLGMSVRDSLIDAGTVRMRPILMTAIATITALLPLALGHSEGALISQALAVVVIGGLTSSTLLTLIIVPVAYELLSRFKKAEPAMEDYNQSETAIGN